MLTNYVEIGGEHLSLTNGFGMWQGVYARSVLNAGSEVLSGELDEQHEFGDSGIYCALGETHNFSANTYASITLGSSIGGFFLPFYRGDAFINHKWLARKQLITTLGLGYYAAKDPHRDRSLSAGTTYYFAKPWIVEDGARFNVSNPGGVLSPSGFIAVTQGTNKHHYITARASYGQEAYQIIGPSNILSSFRSQTFTITWRQWIGRNWGTNGVADYYGSPYYTRVGGTLGLFREF
ncbi:MAG TPA: YaiO family outer membrane beta-barrel protein [Terriglobales bacterium]|nr:YaiO family outer membrane beta-barrel protein [Terriglobales bacterium]